MAKITVYNVEVYDATTDEFTLSRRMATRKGAAMMGGDIIEESALAIDDSQLEPGAQWTATDFKPPQ